jgi:hypothetical protein
MPRRHLTVAAGESVVITYRGKPSGVDTMRVLRKDSGD